nr:fumarylacetoacetate hydrolase family protein [Anaerobacillus isosaccharinicus]MBA5588310.1 fumarylacetoacetate hydrolase family protein [Anaerobacillus isosaccharinicus]QOY38254.1 fumarylacetoacetate hydrolase family protein [Anaerobacillus isosaccharinicus]
MNNFQHIRNIFCVGRNYALHATELGNKIPTKPMIFSKPTHALFPSEGELVISAKKGNIHYEVELVVLIGETYEQGKPIEQIVKGIAMGIDLTAREIQSELKEKGHPWLLAKGFRGSAILSNFIPFSSLEDFNQLEFKLVRNGEMVQIGNPKNMIFPLQILIEYIGTNFGLGKGDIIYTGTPEGVGSIQNGDVLNMQLTNKNNGIDIEYGPLLVKIK